MLNVNYGIDTIPATRYNSPQQHQCTTQRYNHKRKVGIMRNTRNLQNMLEKSGLLPILQLRMNLRATSIDFPLVCIVICNDDTKIKLFDRQDMYKEGATIANVGTINYLDVGFEADVLMALTEGIDCEWDSVENPNNNCPKKWAACETTNYECLLNLFIEHGGVSIEKTMLFFNSSKIDKVHSKNGVYKLITTPSKWKTNVGHHMENCVYYANAEELQDNVVAVIDVDMIFSGENNTLTKEDLLELESFYHIIPPEMLPYIFGISYD